MDFIRKHSGRGLALTVVAVLSLGLGAQCLGAPSASDDDDDPTSEHMVFELGEVVVTSQRPEEDGPTTISEITAEEIERQNATNVGEALRLIPGVHFRQGRAKQEFYVTLRGFEQENVLILLDGVPISVPYEGLVNLTDIPVQNIAKIKVIKGVPSALYGPNGMGGVINIITRTGEPEASTSLHYMGSENATHHARLSHGWKKGRFSYFLAASHRESNGFNLAEPFTLPSSVLDSMAASPANPGTHPNEPIAPDENVRANSDYERDAITFTSQLEINDDHQLGLSLEYYKNSYGVPPVAVFREHPSGFYYFPRYWRFANWERATLNLIEQANFSDVFRMKFRLFYDDYDNILDAYDDSTYSTQERFGPPSGRSEYDDYSTGGNIYGFWDGIPNHQVRFGISFKHDEHSEQFNDSPTDTLAAQTFSLALEDEVRIRNNLSLTLGASYDLFDKKKRDQASAPDDDPGEDVSSFNPQIGLRYQASETAHLYLSVGRKVRFPTMRNLYATGVVGPLGDPDLQEEQSVNYEAGGTFFVSEHLSLDGALFYSDVTNLINFDNQIGRFEQYEKAYIAGGEAGASLQLPGGIVGRVDYTYLTTRNRSTVTVENSFHDPLIYQPDDLPYRPKHQIDMELNKDFPFGLDVNINGSFISDRYYYDHADPSNNQALVGVKRKLDSYTLVNLRLSQAVFSDMLRVNLAVDNVLDQAYQDLLYYPARGRTVWAGVSLDF